MRNVYHVTYNAVGLWVVKKEHSETILASDRLKDNAVMQGQEITKNNKPSQLKVHKMDGTFEYEYTYGNDPVRYPG